MRSQQGGSNIISQQQKQLQEYEQKLKKNRQDQKELQIIIEEKLQNLKQSNQDVNHNPITSKKYTLNPLMYLGIQPIKNENKKSFMGSVAEMYDVGFQEYSIKKLKQMKYKRVLKQQIKERYLRRLERDKKEVENILNRPQPLFMQNVQNPNLSKIQGNLSWMEDIQNEINVSNLLDDDDQMIPGGNKILTKVEQYRLRLKRRDLDLADNQCILLESQLKGYQSQSPPRPIRGLFYRQTYDQYEQLARLQKQLLTKNLIERQIEERIRQKRRNGKVKNIRIKQKHISKQLLKQSSLKLLIFQVKTQMFHIKKV